MNEKEEKVDSIYLKRGLLLKGRPQPSWPQDSQYFLFSTRRDVVLNLALKNTGYMDLEIRYLWSNA
jgi:hypothetical protein